MVHPSPTGAGPQADPTFIGRTTDPETGIVWFIFDTPDLGARVTPAPEMAHLRLIGVCTAEAETPSVPAPILAWCDADTSGAGGAQPRGRRPMLLLTDSPERARDLALASRATLIRDIPKQFDEDDEHNERPIYDPPPWIVGTPGDVRSPGVSTWFARTGPGPRWIVLDRAAGILRRVVAESRADTRGRASRPLDYYVLCSLINQSYTWALDPTLTPRHLGLLRMAACLPPESTVLIENVHCPQLPPATIYPHPTALQEAVISQVSKGVRVAYRGSSASESEMYERARNAGIPVEIGGTSGADRDGRPVRPGSRAPSVGAALLINVRLLPEEEAPAAHAFDLGRVRPGLHLDEHLREVNTAGTEVHICVDDSGVREGAYLGAEADALFAEAAAGEASADRSLGTVPRGRTRPDPRWLQLMSRQRAHLVAEASLSHGGGGNGTLERIKERRSLQLPDQGDIAAGASETKEQRAERRRFKQRRIEGKIDDAKSDTPTPGSKAMVERTGFDLLAAVEDLREALLTSPGKRVKPELVRAVYDASHARATDLAEWKCAPYDRGAWEAMRRVYGRLLTTLGVTEAALGAGTTPAWHHTDLGWVVTMFAPPADSTRAVDWSDAYRLARSLRARPPGSVTGARPDEAGLVAEGAAPRTKGCVVFLRHLLEAICLGFKATSRHKGSVRYQVTGDAAQYRRLQAILQNGPQALPIAAPHPPETGTCRKQENQHSTTSPHAPVSAVPPSAIRRALAQSEAIRLAPDASEHVRHLHEARARAENDLEGGERRARLGQLKALIPAVERSLTASGLLSVASHRRAGAGGRIIEQDVFRQGIPKTFRCYCLPRYDGDVFVSMDWSSCHLRAAAFRSGDANLRDIMERERDPYTAIAGRLLPRVDQVAARAFLKRWTLAAINGGGPRHEALRSMIRGLVGQGSKREVDGESDRLYERFFVMFPALHALIQDTWKGWESAETGREFAVPTHNRCSYGSVVKTAANARSGHRELLSAMWTCMEAEALDHVLVHLPPTAKLVVPMFDGLLVSCPEADAARVSAELRELANAGAAYAGIIGGEVTKVGFGTNWHLAEVNSAW